MSELQLNLREVQNEATATKEELVSYKENCDKLQELLQVWILLRDEIQL